MMSTQWIAQQLQIPIILEQGVWIDMRSTFKELPCHWPLLDHQDKVNDENLAGSRILDELQFISEHA